MHIHYYFLPVLAFIASYFLIKLSLRFELIRINDTPNKRSLHSTATPRYGGVLFVPVILLAAFTFGDSYINTIIAPCSILMFVTVFDDIKHVNFIFRLILHFSISAVYLYLQPGNYNALMYMILLLYFVWSINLANFMDGANGLLGATSAVSFVIYALAFHLSGNNELFIFSLIISAVLLSFLFFNFKAGKIFMGDAGSVSIGFLTAAFGFYGWSQDYWYFWFPLFIIAPAIIDATLTLFVRLISGEKFWVPHQSHIFQRLILMKFSHRKVSTIYTHITFSVGLVALISNYYLDSIFSSLALILVLLFFLVSIILVDKSWSIFNKKKYSFFNTSNISELSLRYHNLLVIAFDFCLILFSWYLSFAVRFNFDVPNFHLPLILDGTILVFTQAFSFYFFSIQKSSWRYSDISDFLNIIHSVLIAFFIIIIFYILTSNISVSQLINISSIPKSIIFLDFLFLTILLCFSRLLFRIIYESANVFSKTKNIAIVGVSEESISILKQLRSSSTWNLIGFIGDSRYEDRAISGVPVIGSIGNLKELHSLFNLDHLILSDFPNSTTRRDVFRLCHKLGIRVLSVPLINSLLDGSIKVPRSKSFNIEDLLGRKMISSFIDNPPNFITDQTILVSGAGGSIGSELCSQIVKFNPKLLICLDISESALYQLSLSLNTKTTKIIFIVADVKDKVRIPSILSKYLPNSILHAAAYKHVPLMESENISQAFINNSYGTYFFANEAKKHGVEKFILISTDKAINPTNIMGASKRLAEIYCQYLCSATKTKFITVRFGNVVGSSGSAIPLFQDQIENGGPITITHPDITRYFMSINEACHLVLQAGDIGNGGDVLILDMGSPIKVIDLVKDMIALSGFSEDDIEIKFIGLRPGEKLYEELLADDEKTLPTKNNKIRIAMLSNKNNIDVNKSLIWIKGLESKDEKFIKSELKEWVVDYKSSSN